MLLEELPQVLLDLLAEILVGGVLVGRVLSLIQLPLLAEIELLGLLLKRLEQVFLLDALHL